VVRERSDPVPSEPEALCRLAKRGLEGVTPGSDHNNPRGEPDRADQADHGCRRSRPIRASHTR
jgi:hypothetical protein